MKFLKYLLLSLALMIPAFAFADNLIRPPGLDMWELYVMGNGPVIAEVLESIKLVIAPDAGGGGYRSLLVFMALTGFCILAIQAGFNPGQNLFKMFGYLFVVWVVSLTSTQLKADILVIDPISNTETAVQKVPAVVAIPAAVVSGVGHYMTETIQTAFSSVDDNLMMTKSGFDIFGKIQSDLDQYTITRPELKRSMGAYVTDCMVPALAQQRLTAQDLYKSTNLVETMKKGESKVWLTRYWAEAPASATPTTSLGLNSDLVDCTSAYASITKDLEKHAQQMLTAGTAEWSRSGVMIPFETALSTYVESANIGRGEGGGIYGRPTGIITQKALLNTMGGDFRNAAIQTGNNELLMGLQISQAEQSQKSGWVTSAAVFKNMMGYVYTTLQAFIYAIVPIVVVALMIPGLGKKIFTNYGQILVWLTLWEPMLSIINHLVTLFRVEGIRNAVAGSGGLNMVNTWTISEGANNMVIAASFLGTMVPILCWGLVTGAMAFNEFISQGVGSSFAMTAGANAATGSVGLNQANMNTLTSNKFDNAQKSTVGSQSVMAHETAGILTTANDQGGQEHKRNGGSISASGSMQKALAETAGTNESATYGKNAGQNASAGTDFRQGESDSVKTGREFGTHRAQEESTGVNGSDARSVGAGVSTSESAKTSQGGKVSDGVTFATTAGSSVSPGSAGGGAGKGAAGGAGGSGFNNPVKTNLGVSGQQSTTNSSEMGASLDKGASASQKADSSTSITNTASQGTSSGARETVSSGASHSTESSRGNSFNKGTSVGESTSVQSGTSRGTSATQQQSDTHSWQRDLTGKDVEALDHLEQRGFGSVTDAVAAHNAFYQAQNASIAEASGITQSAASNLAGAGGGPSTFSHTDAAGPGANAASALSGFQSTVNTSTDIVNKGVATQTGSTNAFMSNNLAGSQSMFADQMSFGKGATGGAPFAVNDDISWKKSAVTAGGVLGIGSSAASLASSIPGAGTAVARGAAMAGPAIGATAGVAAAGAAGWYTGRALVSAVGEERVTEALTPAFQTIDRAFNIQH
jgi:hypothetical protein